MKRVQNAKKEKAEKGKTGPMLLGSRGFTRKDEVADFSHIYITSVYSGHSPYSLTVQIAVLFLMIKN
jgi:hypothetical protein